MSTRTWDETTPQGTSQASLLDDVLRLKWTDIRERMDDVTTGWSGVGPVVLKPGNLGAKNLVARWVPYAAGIATGTYSIDSNGDFIYTSGQNNSFELVIPLIVPVGATLQLINLIGYRETNSTQSAIIRRMQPTGASSQVSQATHGLPGSWLTYSMLANYGHVVTENEFFVVKVSCAGPSLALASNIVRFMGLAYYYDLPNLSVR